MPIDVADLLHELGEILSHTLGAAVDVRLRLQAGLAPLLADRGQLETVLVNLATNARDAMPDGGELTLSADHETVAAGAAPVPVGLAPGQYIRLTVADAGVGMDAATLARAREPFFTTKQSGAGTGLGLAMAQAFAEQSGGALAIESQPGKGRRSRFGCRRRCRMRLRRRFRTPPWRRSRARPQVRQRRRASPLHRRGSCWSMTRQ